MDGRTRNQSYQKSNRMVKPASHELEKKKFIATRLLLLLLFFLGALGLFGWVMHEVIGEQEVQFDERVIEWLRPMITPGRTSFLTFITFFGSRNFLLFAYGILILIYLIKKNTRRAFEMGFIGIGGFLLMFFLKLFFHRVRPANPLIAPLKNFSFPSGHATSSFIFCGILIYLIWKSKWNSNLKIAGSVFLLFFSLLIGFSRVYLRLHFASDVFAGFCLGFAWIAASIYFMERIKKKVRLKN
jgi:membrane-associated phospholipid phosphatase